MGNRSPDRASWRDTEPAGDPQPRHFASYFRLGDGKLISLDGNGVELEAEVDAAAEALGLCCFGFLASRLLRR
jgi:hypothetical protein